MVDNVKSEILKYIETEKDIARFNIKRLEKRKDIEPSKKRILEIEREFVSIPFEVCDFEDVADVAAAISIYRTSRSLFYKTYGIKKPIGPSRKVLLEKLDQKVSFIKESAKEFATNRVEEVNLVQDEDLFFDLSVLLAKKERKTLLEKTEELNRLSLDELLKIEPITLAKDRARRQAILFSLGTHLENELKKISFDEDMELNEIFRQIDIADSIMLNITKNTFKYFNNALNVLPSKFNNGMGQNIYFKKVHRLKNVLNFDNLVRDLSSFPMINDKEINFDHPTLLNLANEKSIIGFGFSREKRKKSKSKAIGILLPIQRIGNEKMTYMYGRVCVNGLCISNILDSHISNIKVYQDDNETYFKALMMKPLWAILDSSNVDKYRSIISSLIKYNFSNIEEFDDPSIIKLINNQNEQVLMIDEDSIILVPKTRSEEDAFSKIMPWLNLRQNELIAKYSATTNDNILD